MRRLANPLTLFQALLVTILAAALLAPPGTARAEKRAALVIGINDYDDLPKLEKAVGDAEAMAVKLRQLGFETTEVLNADRRTLNQAISVFSASLGDGDTAFVHFSGHGVEIDGENYLLPSDIPRPTLGQDDFVKSEAIAMSNLIGRIAAGGARTRVFVIDACRDNPFEQLGTRGIGATRGLARVEAPAGTFIMYSAGYRQLALDRLGRNDKEPTSVYTRTLLKHLGEPGKTIAGVAQDVRIEVEQLARRIGHQQRPAYYDELSARLILVEADATADEATNEPSRPAISIEEASQAWDATKETTNPVVLELFIDRFDGTYFAELARIRLNELTDDGEGPAETVPQTDADTAQAPVPADESEQTVASLSDADDEPTDTDIDPRELARALQVELDRLGCAPGKADGVWGRKSRAALSRFNEHAATRLASTDPTVDSLKVLKGTPSRVCPLVCGVQYEVKGDRCVKKTCGTGQALNSRGVCVAAASPDADPQSGAIRGCVRLSIRVAARDANNLAWDPIPGSTEPPDITVYDGRSRARLFGCNDSFGCAGTLNASGPTISLLINDDDYDAPDHIGQGQCSLSRRSCTLGLARIRIARCN